MIYSISIFVTITKFIQELKLQKLKIVSLFPKTVLMNIVIDIGKRMKILFRITEKRVSEQKTNSLFLIPYPSPYFLQYNYYWNDYESDYQNYLLHKLICGRTNSQYESMFFENIEKYKERYEKENK
jgi:hypothetical protein